MPVTAVAKPSKKTFQSLSSELKSSIIEQITRPSDLKNVCLVSKELHELAVRFLYHDVSLDLGSVNDNFMPALLNPRNIGLQHIRQVRLYLANKSDRCNQEQQATLSTRMLLEFLPENILEEFRCGFTETWCPWRPFSAENMMLLYRRQKGMKWLEAMDMDRPILEELKKSPNIEKNLFDNARKLALYPENRESLNLGRYFVEKITEKLEELIIHAHFETIDDHSPSRSDVSVRELNDTATGPGLLARTLFGHLMPFESCTKFQNLTSLRLHRISLRYCADTWCKFVDFHKMQCLRIYHCPGVDSLLGQLSRAAHLPKKLHVLELQHKDNTENEALLALEGFLCLVSGLNDLIIDLQNVKALPAVAGLVRHHKTLELLNIHCSGEGSSTPLVGDMSCDAEELVYDMEEFDKICSATSHLEQLSCAWPNRSLIRSPSEEWCAFEHAVAKLRNLVTLHITTWPSNKPSTQLLPRSVYEQLLQAASTRLFELASKRTPSTDMSISIVAPAQPPIPSSDSASGTETLLPPAKLRLIAFGISDKIYEREDSRNQLLYLRSTALDAEGKNKIYATPVGWCARRYLEPRSEVLDFVLGRETRLPCRGERGDMDARFGFNVDEDD